MAVEVSRCNDEFGRKLFQMGACGLGCAAWLQVQTKMVAITLKASGAVPKAKHGTLTDRAGAARVFSDQRTQDLTVPAL
jgi:hypothetical protein